MVVLFIILCSTPLMSQFIPAKFGNGLLVQGVDSTFQLTIGFRFQNLLMASWSLADETQNYTASSNYDAQVRRARLKFDGWAHTTKLTYKLELALSNRDNGGGGDRDEFGNAANIILDAHLTYNFYKNVSVRFGQGKLAGNRERVISSGDMQFVTRSRLNSGFNIDRDLFIGLMNQNTFGDKFIVKQSASIGTGEGKNHLTGYNGGYVYTYRLDFLPFGKFKSNGDYVGSSILKEQQPKLAVGFTYDNNNNAGRERGQLGNFIINANGDVVGKDLNTFFADLMFKYQGFSLMLEYADKEAEDGPLVFDSDGSQIGQYYTGSAYNIAAGYMFKNNIEIAARYTEVNADIATDENHYTVGLNKFFVGHKLKIQSEFSIVNRQEAQNIIFWRNQVDIHF